MAAGEELLERGAEEQSLREALSSAESGSAAVLFLVGRAGLGKTSLVRIAAQMAHERGFEVALATGSPMETALPFGLIGQAIGCLSGSPVEDVLGVEEVGGQPTRLYRALRFVESKATTRPLLLAFDDLHWGDPESVAMIGFLARRLSGACVAVVGTLRPEPDDALMLAGDLSQRGQGSLLELRPLSDAGSIALLERLSAAVLGSDEQARIVEACAGTPLLLEAAARQRPGVLLEPAGGAGTRLLLERFAGLGARAFSYVQAAAIFGVRFRPAEAAKLAGIGAHEAAVLHRTLVRAGLIDELEAGSARFVHPLFSQALLDTQTPLQLERAHAGAFRLLLEEGDSDELAAQHAIAACLVGDKSAIEVVRRAGRSALAKGASASAARYFEGVLALTPAPPPPEARLDYATALIDQGRMEETQGIGALVLSDPAASNDVRARTLALLARTAMLSEHPDQMLERYEEAIAIAQAGELEAELIFEACLTGLVPWPVGYTLPLAERGLELVAPSHPGRPLLEFLAAYCRLLCRCEGGDLKSFLARLAGSGSAFPGMDPSLAWTVALHALNVAKILESPEDAAAIFEKDFARALEVGAPVLLDVLGISYADQLHRNGRVREALDLVEQSAAISGRHNQPWASLARAVLLGELGRDGEAERHLEVLRRAVEQAPEGFNGPAALWLHLLEGRRLLERGLVEEASATMEHEARIAEKSGFLEPCIVPWAATAIEAHAAAGRVALAAGVVDWLEPVARGLRCRWPAAVAEAGRARLAELDGDAAKAERHLGDALALLEQVPYPLARSELLLSIGRFLRRQRRQREARSPLARALELAESGGSVRLARQARSELAAAGGRRRRLGAPDELTPQEQRVAALVLDGLSNAEIGAALYVSAKTVEHHLSRIYAKLGVASRRELRRLATSSPDRLGASPR